MKREKILVETFTFRITNELLEKYRIYCDENGLSLSKRLRLLIEKDIENKIEIKK